MKFFVLDVEDGMGIDLALRAKEHGHQVKYWHKEADYGQGLVETTKDWEQAVKWAEFTVTTGCADYPRGFEKYIGTGHPIWGTNAEAAKLELDRAKGQEVLERYRVETLPYVAVDSIDEAAAYLRKTQKCVVIKPWGGEADKAMTHVCSDVDDGLFTLDKWKRAGLKGRLMLQDKADGVEIGISGFFGPGGWNSAIEESFEHKKFLTGNLGQNTGEMGTVIRHVDKSLLFDRLLDPITDYLHLVRYVGDCSVNAIVTDDGTPYPLEFTMRLGWPDFCIRQAVIRGDPIKWMVELVHGRDALRIARDVAIGVVMPHGDFPNYHDKPEKWSGYPIHAEDDSMLSWQQIKLGKYPTLKGEQSGIVTAGVYPLVATGTGPRVRTAKRHAYQAVEGVKWPSNIMYRLDIGDRLEEDLPALHKNGYAIGMEY